MGGGGEHNGGSVTSWRDKTGAAGLGSRDHPGNVTVSHVRCHVPPIPIHGDITITVRAASCYQNRPTILVCIFYEISIFYRTRIPPLPARWNIMFNSGIFPSEFPKTVFSMRLSNKITISRSIVYQTEAWLLDRDIQNGTKLKLSFISPRGMANFILQKKTQYII